jgi:tetratricopeptide (TPR) repeat protein
MHKPIQTVSIFFLCLWTFSLQAQNDKIALNYLEFHSDFERKGFEAFEKGDSNFYYLLFATSSPIDSILFQEYGSRLNEIYTSLDSARLVKKSPKKIVKTIFSTVHNNLLVRYKEKNLFFEIFQNGYYNCVSATAVYSYMLGRLGFQHALVETPTHVLVVAFIKGEDWVFESTDPQQGFYEITDEGEEKFIQMLLDQKLITKEELNSEVRDSILHSFSPSNSIKVARLVAIQYLNQMLYALEEDKLEEAFQNGLKAKFVHAEGDLNAADQVIWSWIEKHDYSNPYYFDILRYAWAGMPTEDRQLFSNSIEYYGQQWMEGEISEERFQQWADFFSSAFIDLDSNQSYVNAQIEIIRGTHAFNQGEVLNTLHFGIKAMNINESSQRARSLLLYGLAQGSSLGLIGEEDLMDSVFTYTQRYPSLLEFPLWRNLVAQIYISKAIYSIERKQFSQAEKNLESMEALLQGTLPEIIHRDHLSRAYSKVAHYVYQRNSKQALEWVERGLRYVPEDPLLNNLKAYYSKN